MKTEDQKSFLTTFTRMLSVKTDDGKFTLSAKEVAKRLDVKPNAVYASRKSDSKLYRLDKAALFDRAAEFLSSQEFTDGVNNFSIPINGKTLEIKISGKKSEILETMNRLLENDTIYKIVFLCQE